MNKITTDDKEWEEEALDELLNYEPIELTDYYTKQRRIIRPEQFQRNKPLWPQVRKVLKAYGIKSRSLRPPRTPPPGP